MEENFGGITIFLVACGIFFEARANNQILVNNSK